MHALRFDYSATNASMQPYNSTDVSGIRHSIIMLRQFVNTMKVQYLFNLQGSDQCGSQTKMSHEDLHRKLKQAFFT